MTQSTRKHELMIPWQAVLFLAILVMACPFIPLNPCGASELHTSLYYAVQNDDMDTLKALLKKSGAVINEGDGDLLRAAVDLHKEPLVVKMLLDAGANPNLQEKNSGDTALHLALGACNGQNNALILQYAKLLVDKGANVSQKRVKEGYTPLHVAARNENIDKDIFAVLLTGKNADVNVRCNPINESEDGAWQPLFYLATRAQDFKKSGGAVARMLIDKGADLKEVSTSEGQARRKAWNVLHLCCGTENDHVDVVEVLLNAGLNIETRTKDEGLTPLHIAMSTNNPKICTLLLSKGADFNSKDTEGVSVLQHAKGWGTDKHYESAKVVIDWASSHAK
jgi:ankyrin repeat protein